MTENSHGQPLDGTGDIKPTPFDAHEQATRGTHVPTTENSPNKPEDEVQEYPKAVEHVPHPSGVGLAPVIATGPEHEEELEDAKGE